MTSYVENAGHILLQSYWLTSMAFAHLKVEQFYFYHPNSTKLRRIKTSGLEQSYCTLTAPEINCTKGVHIVNHTGTN